MWLGELQHTVTDEVLKGPWLSVELFRVDGYTTQLLSALVEQEVSPLQLRDVTSGLETFPPRRRA